MAEHEGGGASRTTEPAAGSSAATDVSIREFLSSRIDANQRMTTERFGFAAALGAVIWFFVERHMAELNHENARVAKVTDNSVSQDTYRANEQQRTAERAKDDAWRNKVDLSLGRNVTREELQSETKTDRRGNWTVGMQIAAFGVSVMVASLLAFTTYRALKPAVPSSDQATTVFVQTTTTKGTP